MDKSENVVGALSEVLKRLQSSTPGVLGCAVISTDGFTIASELPDSIEEERNAAMAAAMLALGQQTMEEFNQGCLRRIFIEGDLGHVIVVSAGDEALLSAIAQKEAKLGLVFLQMQRAAEHIRAAMG